MTPEQLQSGIVLPIDKPYGWTSFQAVNKVKAVIRNTYGLKKIKIGHAGTLDPLATGLLLVCIGKATKTIPTLQEGDKVYTGTMVLGATTPCYDLEQAIDHFYPYGHIDKTMLDEVRRRFEGTVMQVPPMFSAVKTGGRRAYLYARADDPTVTLQPKAVTIYSFEITAFREAPRDLRDLRDLRDPRDPRDLRDLQSSRGALYKHPQGSVPPHLPQVDFRVRCGKGTYIRSLARDFGLALGSGAFLSALRRQRIGLYDVADARHPEFVNSLIC